MGKGGSSVLGCSCEKERGRQEGSTCQTTTANIQTVAVRSGQGLCLHSKQGGLDLLHQRKQFTLSSLADAFKNRSHTEKTPSFIKEVLKGDALKLFNLTAEELGPSG